MIQTRRAQRTFGDGLIAEEVKDLHEEWMKHADRMLADKEIVAAIYEALAKRHPQSRTRGRPGTPAEVVLRWLVLKHMRNWSYGVLEREVRANLVYREDHAEASFFTLSKRKGLPHLSGSRPAAAVVLCAGRRDKLSRSPRHLE